MKVVIATQNREKGLEYAKTHNYDATQIWIDKDDIKAKAMNAEIVYLDKV